MDILLLPTEFLVALTKKFKQVVKENQIIHKGSRIIEDESATLADMNIFAGDILWVTDSEIHEYRDIAGKYPYISRMRKEKEKTL